MAEIVKRLKSTLLDQGWAAANVNPDRSISVWVAHRDGSITNQEEFKYRDPLRVFRVRRGLATAGALALRGAALLEMGATGAGIARGLRHKSLPEVVFSAAVGGGAVVVTEAGSEHCRLTVRSLRDREEKVIKAITTSIPQEPKHQS